MAVYDLEEQDQLEDLKAWWARYGKYVAGVLMVAAIVLIGNQAWRQPRRQVVRDDAAYLVGERGSPPLRACDMHAVGSAAGDQLRSIEL